MSGVRGLMMMRGVHVVRKVTRRKHDGLCRGEGLAVMKNDIKWCVL